MTYKEIEENVVNVLKKYFPKIKVGVNENLFDPKFMILPLDMIYIVMDIEKVVGIQITDMFKNEDVEIMTIYKISKYIYNKVNAACI